MFSIEKNAFFWEIVFIDLVGPHEMILYLSQYLSQYLLDSFKLFFEVFHTRYYLKNLAETIFSLEN